MAPLPRQVVGLDCLFALVRYLLCNPLDACFAISKVPRFSRPLRVYLVIYVLHFVRLYVQRILLSLLALVDVAVVAGFVLALFAFFGVVNFGALDEGPTASFANFDAAMRSLFMLLTAENYDLVWDTYALRPSSMVYFILFTMFSLFLLAMFLSSVYSSYQKYRKMHVVKQLKNEALSRQKEWQNVYGAYGSIGRAPIPTKRNCHHHFRARLAA